MSFSLPVASAITPTQVFVSTGSRGSPSSPQFLKEPQDTEANEGEEVVLECAAAPAIGYLWFQNGVSVQFESSQILGIGNLRFDNVKATNAGVYYCKAIGIINNSSRSVNLIVNGKTWVVSYCFLMTISRNVALLHKNLSLTVNFKTMEVAVPFVFRFMNVSL